MWKRGELEEVKVDKNRRKIKESEVGGKSDKKMTWLIDILTTNHQVLQTEVTWFTLVHWSSNGQYTGSESVKKKDDEGLKKATNVMTHRGSRQSWKSGRRQRPHTTSSWQLSSLSPDPPVRGCCHGNVWCHQCHLSVMPLGWVSWMNIKIRTNANGRYCTACKGSISLWIFWSTADQHFLTLL